MKRTRVLGLVVAVAVAAVVAWRVSSGGDTVLEVERLLAAGDAKGAKTELDRARERLDEATRLYLDGLIHIHAGRDAEALPGLEAAWGRRPDDWRIVSALFAAASNTGARGRAREVLGRYLRDHPEDERALAAAAQHWLDPRAFDYDPERALEYLRRIEALPRRVAPPGDPTAVTDASLAELRARAELETRRTLSALEDARKAVALTPQDPRAWTLLGELARHARRGDECIDAYRKARRLAPDDRRLKEQLVMALLEFDGPAGEALRLADELLARWGDEPGLHILRARALVRVDRIDQAIDLYRRLLGLTDLTPEQRRDVLRNLAAALLDWKQGGREGEYRDEAHKLLREYLRLGGELENPQLLDLWEQLENAAREKGGR